MINLKYLTYVQAGACMYRRDGEGDEGISRTDWPSTIHKPRCQRRLGIKVRTPSWRGRSPNEAPPVISPLDDEWFV